MHEDIRTYFHELADRIADRAERVQINQHTHLKDKPNYGTGMMEREPTGEITVTVWWKEPVDGTD